MKYVFEICDKSSGETIYEEELYTNSDKEALAEAKTLLFKMADSADFKKWGIVYLMKYKSEDELTEEEMEDDEYLQGEALEIMYDYQDENRANSFSFEIENGVLTGFNGNVYNDYDIFIPDGIIRIASDCFTFNDSICSIVIPASVEVVETNAFYCCKSLDTVIVKNKNTVFEENAIYHCFIEQSEVTYA